MVASRFAQVGAVSVPNAKAVVGIEQLVAALDRQTEAISGLLQAFAVLAGEELGAPDKDDPEPSPHSTMDSEGLIFRGQRQA